MLIDLRGDLRRRLVMYPDRRHLLFYSAFGLADVLQVSVVEPRGKTRFDQIVALGQQTIERVELHHHIGMGLHQLVKAVVDGHGQELLL